ncbi:MAG: hypothetical protein JO013_16055 [Alphaproteobacteria bacterium]|nr:hypothetical protein [Alphaproteobacteria bacterium]
MIGTATALLAGGPVLGQAPAEGPPQKVVNVTVYGNDPCPKSSDGVIVVCGRRSDNERYRIPKELRHRGEQPSETSWASRTRALEEASRPSMPGSCSPVGSWGQTGCFQQMLRQWAAARAQARSDAASQP